MNRQLILQYADRVLDKVEENLVSLPSTAPAHEILAIMETLNLVSKIYERYGITDNE